jgi:hypothetical protein
VVIQFSGFGEEGLCQWRRPGEKGEDIKRRYGLCVFRKVDEYGGAINRVQQHNQNRNSSCGCNLAERAVFKIFGRSRVDVQCLHCGGEKNKEQAKRDQPSDSRWSIREICLKPFQCPESPARTGTLES